MARLVTNDDDDARGSAGAVEEGTRTRTIQQAGKQWLALDRSASAHLSAQVHAWCGLLVGAMVAS